MIAGPAIQQVAHIDYRCESFDWAFPREAAARIDAHWAAIVAAKPAVYDGRVLLAHRAAVRPANGGTLEAAGFETGYKAFLCWRDFGFPGGQVANLFSMGALRSADGAFMLGEMGQGTTSAGRLYFPAGTPEPCDVRDGVVDLEGNILRELEEETGLRPGDVTLAAGWTLIADEGRLACLKAVDCPLSAAAMIERFEAFRRSQSDPELAALVPVRSAEDLDATRMPGFMLSYLRAAFAA